MRVLVFQHTAIDGPGYIGEALLQRGATLDICHLNEGQMPPHASAYDLLLVMGGEMNVYQQDRHPWLADETRLVRETAQQGQAVFGICLGGQLLAKALGATVRLGAAPEIGLAHIDLTSAGRADPLFEGLNGLEAFVWHDDTFDVPTGALALAGSTGCANQAFRYGDRAYGLQFHPEVTPAMLAQWIDAAPYLTAEAALTLRNGMTLKVGSLQAQADRLVDNFLQVIS